MDKERVQRFSDTVLVSKIESRLVRNPVLRQSELQQEQPANPPDAIENFRTSFNDMRISLILQYLISKLGS